MGLSHGPDSSLTVVLRMGCLITWLLVFPPLRGTNADCNQRGHRLSTAGLSPGWEEAYEKKQTLKMFPSSSVTENTWKQLVSEKYSRKTMVLSLPGQPGWVCLQTRELDQPSAWFYSLLHFGYFEGYCNTNTRKWSKMVLQVYWNSQTVLLLSTWIAIWALEQSWKVMPQAFKVDN